MPRLHLFFKHRALYSGHFGAELFQTPLGSIDDYPVTILEFPQVNKAKKKIKISNIH